MRVMHAHPIRPTPFVSINGHEQRLPMPPTVVGDVVTFEPIRVEFEGRAEEVVFRGLGDWIPAMHVAFDYPPRVYPGELLTVSYTMKEKR